LAFLFSHHTEIRMRIHPSLTLSVLTAALLAAGAARASGGHDHHYARDHDRARAALERGEVRPIGEVLAAAAAAVPGDVVEVELERERGRWVYELKVIAPDGRVIEVLMDAASASVLAIEDHH
jgi:uncharacterized membrane protein YkoI